MADLTTVEVAERMLAAGKTQAKIKIGYKDMIITRDFEREDFDTFQTFRVEGVRLRLGLIKAER